MPLIECQHCEFWKKLPGGPPYKAAGECHRHAPVAGRSLWPKTAEDDGCGEGVLAAPRDVEHRP